jgi:hypothetical protein
MASRGSRFALVENHGAGARRQRSHAREFGASEQVSITAATERSVSSPLTGSVAFMPRSSTYAWIVCAILFPTTARAQRMTFSIERTGPTIGLVDPVQSRMIKAADVLGPFNGAGAPFPGIAQPAPTNVPGIWQRGAAVPGGIGLTALPAEMDALSHGVDRGVLTSSGPRWFFSVDRFAVGVAGAGPDVASEAPGADASADVFMDLGLPNGPLAPPPPTVPLMGNRDRFDGNAIAGFSGFTLNGIGLVEPVPPLSPFIVDDLDALDLGHAAGSIGGTPFDTYFSLDAGFVDPLTGLPHTNSAAANGFAGGDVVVSVGGTLSIYAPAITLGLDQNAEGEDDLDALVLLENGVPGYQPDETWGGPTAWLEELEQQVEQEEGSGLPVDILLFSVRRGSAIIGQPDSRFGAPICAGDILTPPIFFATNPGIFIAAEHLGLVVNRLSPALADELDALDAWTYMPGGVPIHDCNGNGIDDLIDISNGTSLDLNGDGIPDECQGSPTTHCVCEVNSCGGCASVAYQNQPTLTSSDPDFHITTTQVVANVNGMLLVSVAGRAMVPWAVPGHGFRCIATPYRTLPAGNSGGVTCTALPPTGSFDVNFSPYMGGAGYGVGATVNVQFYYADPAWPAGYQYDTSDGFEFTVVP